MSCKNEFIVFKSNEYNCIVSPRLREFEGHSITKYWNDLYGSVNRDLFYSKVKNFFITSVYEVLKQQIDYHIFIYMAYNCILVPKVSSKSLLLQFTVLTFRLTTLLKPHIRAKRNKRITFCDINLFTEKLQLFHYSFQRTM